MTDTVTDRNKLAAKILKAEMLGDIETLETLRAQLTNLVDHQSNSFIKKIERHGGEQSSDSNIKAENSNQPQQERTLSDNTTNNRNKRAHESDMTIQQMYIQEKIGSVKDEVKLYLNNHKKFAKDNFDTNQFSEEIDDSQIIMQGSSNKPRKTSDTLRYPSKNKEHQPCGFCPQNKLKHLVLWQGQYVFMSLLQFKLSLSRLSCTVIRNLDHDHGCFVDSNDECQSEAQNIIKCLRCCWDKQGYQCIVMECYHKNSRKSDRNLLPNSGGNHFQLYCIPIKEKYYEEARLYFKQALLECEKEWSMNKKLIVTSDDKNIQNCLPKGLSYFWVCFNDINKGFAHVIEDESRFSTYFGFEVLAGLLDKNITEVLHPTKEDYSQQFERSRQFKLRWCEYKPD